MMSWELSQGIIFSNIIPSGCRSDEKWILQNFSGAALLPLLHAQSFLVEYYFHYGRRCRRGRRNRLRKLWCSWDNKNNIKISKLMPWHPLSPMKLKGLRHKPPPETGRRVWVREFLSCLLYIKFLIEQLSSIFHKRFLKHQNKSREKMFSSHTPPLGRGGVWRLWKLVWV